MEITFSDTCEICKEKGIFYYIKARIWRCKEHRIPQKEVKEIVKKSSFGKNYFNKHKK